MSDPLLAPFSGRFFTHGHGWRQHYLDQGTGPVVVMLHGNPTWSFYYRNLVQALCGTHRCIVPDHIGCGRSDKPSAAAYPYTLQARVDDLDALLAQLDVGDRVTLVVHDWGGMIGMAWASRHPERVARLVILNTGAFPLPPEKPLPLVLKLGRNSALGAWLILRHNAFARVAARIGCKRRPMDKALRDAYCAPYDTPANRIATLRFVQDIPLGEGDPGFALVKQVAAGLDRFAPLPMLICWGERDFVFDRHFRAEWQQRFPQAEVHSFPDCGHYILEDARDEVVGLIGTFLQRHQV